MFRNLGFFIELIRVFFYKDRNDRCFKNFYIFIIFLLELLFIKKLDD